MIEIVEACLGLIGKLTDDVCIGEMAIDASKLFVSGFLPSGVNAIHAVTRSADLWAPRGLISCDQDGHKDCTSNDTCGQQLSGRKA
jgi:hypothetical protein